MPLTFPSHAAAIIPLLHLRWTRRLSPTALVIGSTAPDLVYLVGINGEAAHRPWGLLSYCLPAGLLAFFYLEALLFPVLSPIGLALLPRSWQQASTSLMGPRPLPAKLADWFAVVLAIVIGAATHQLWDGFTHAWMWPARTLYPGVTVGLLGHQVIVSRVLQHLSSAAGMGIVLWYLAWAARPRSPGEPVQGDRAGATRQLLRLVLLPLLGAMVAGMVTLRHPDALLSRAIWHAAWASVAWFVLLLGAACLIARMRYRGWTV